MPELCSSMQRVGMPRCSARQVMHRAMNDIEVRGTTVGTLTFTQGAKGPAWSLQMGPLRIKSIADDC